MATSDNMLLNGVEWAKRGMYDGASPGTKASLYETMIAIQEQSDEKRKMHIKSLRRD